MKTYYLHGMGGGPQDWEQVAEELPGIRLELRAASNFNEAAEAITKTLCEEKEPFLLCGYSLGGRLSIRAASKLREAPLAGLVLLSAGLGFENAQTRAERMLSDEDWAKLAQQDFPKFWKKWYGQDLFSAYQRLPEALKSGWLKDRLAMDSEAVRSQLLNLSPARHDFLLPELLSLHRTGLPILYVAGNADTKYKGLAERLKAEGLAVEMIDAGHILPLEAPAQVARILRKFVARLEKGK